MDRNRKIAGKGRAPTGARAGHETENRNGGNDVNKTDKELLEMATRVGGDLMTIRDERLRAKSLERLIEDADVFFAIVHGPANDCGLNKVLVKGAVVLQELASSGKPRKLGISAICVAEEEFALALRLVFGDGRSEGGSSSPTWNGRTTATIPASSDGCG